MHLKRINTDRKYPIPRKGTKYVARAANNIGKGLPLLIILRDLLKLGKDRKEIKNILNKGEIEVNGKIRKDEKFSVLVFDILKIKSTKKLYTLKISKHKKFEIVETKNENKISKVINKRKLTGNKTQVNLLGGYNFITKDNINTGDSAVIDFAGKKILKIIPLEEGKRIVILEGRHTGEEGKVLSIKKDMTEVSIDNKKVNVKIENLMAI